MAALCVNPPQRPASEAEPASHWPGLQGRGVVDQGTKARGRLPLKAGGPALRPAQRAPSLRLGFLSEGGGGASRQRGAFEGIGGAGLKVLAC